MVISGFGIRRFESRPPITVHAPGFRDETRGGYSLYSSHIRVSEKGDSDFGRDSGFGIQNSGYLIRDSGFGIQDSGFGFRVSGFGIRDSSFGMRGSRLP